MDKGKSRLVACCFRNSTVGSANQIDFSLFTLPICITNLSYDSQCLEALLERLNIDVVFESLHRHTTLMFLAVLPEQLKLNFRIGFLAKEQPTEHQELYWKM